jgi:hypothetical protein
MRARRWSSAAAQGEGSWRALFGGCGCVRPEALVFGQRWLSACCGRQVKLRGLAGRRAAARTGRPRAPAASAAFSGQHNGGYTHRGVPCPCRTAGRGPLTAWGCTAGPVLQRALRADPLLGAEPVQEEREEQHRRGKHSDAFPPLDPLPTPARRPQGPLT